MMLLARVNLGNVTKSRASDWIGRLRQLPRSTEVVEFADVPDGRYALRMPNDTVNPIHFYTFKTGRAGTQWAGRRFLKRHSSDDRFPVRGATRVDVLQRIAQDPRGATILYGHETNHCGLCGRELTVEESRDRGIGPKCAERVGWL